MASAARGTLPPKRKNPPSPASPLLPLSTNKGAVPNRAQLAGILPRKLVGTVVDARPPLQSPSAHDDSRKHCTSAPPHGQSKPSPGKENRVMMGGGKGGMGPSSAAGQVSHRRIAELLKAADGDERERFHRRHGATLPPARKACGGASGARVVLYGKEEDWGAKAESSGRGLGENERQTRVDVGVEEGLSEEQAEAVKTVRAGKSVLITGSAGTGKSIVLQAIIRALPPATTFITASTGLAACQLGGTTLNHFAGIGYGEGSVEEIVARVRRRPGAADRWRKAAALVVDEVSMLDGDLFDTLEHVGRLVRGDPRPFGGIQLILSGDFHQLPPVQKGRGGQRPRFCFEAHSWRRCIGGCVMLTKVYRQMDGDFVTLLGAIREGRVSKNDLRTLKERSRTSASEDDGILPTKLHTHKDDVNEVNLAHLAELPGEPVRFIAEDNGAGASGPAGSSSSMKGMCPAKDILELKVGAQVILLKSIGGGKGLCNGARGVVERFAAESRLPVVRFATGAKVVVGRETWRACAGGRVIGQRRQIPLDLAWAISIHKSQGLSLDRVEVSLGRVFECGQAYVALSRARSLAGLTIVGDIPPDAIRAHPKVLAFYESLKTA